MKRIPLLVVAFLALAALTASAADLPLSRVVLFSTGVGYFQHDGTVDGDATVPLSFRVDQINDILKSLVLMDQGGTVGPVTYASREPLSKALAAFSINLGDNPSLYQLLLRLRGSEAQISLGRDSLRGLILGVESQQVTVKDTTETLQYLNLLTDKGLHSLPLNKVTAVKLTDTQLNGELNAALAALAAARDTTKREVSLSFLGEGQRLVSAAYLLETPVWKTTYRLVVDGKAPYLQGWALVENTSDSDWTDVEMALVSGRPVSFTQNLYEPLYAYRPNVPVALPIPVAPRIAEGTLEAEQQLAFGPDKFDNLTAKIGPAGAAGAMAPGMARAERKRAAEFSVDDSGVLAAASGERVGELFQYDITQPVTIPRQKSAMIPIIATDKLSGEKVDLYNAQSNAQHPLSAFRLKNTSGLHLMAGALTVFDGGAYAGDALLDDLAPGDERLVTYALDLGTEVATDRTDESAEVGFRIDGGVVFFSLRRTFTLTYTLKNRTEQPKTVLVEQPIMSGWKLLAPEKPAEITASYYRFRVALAPGAAEKLVVKFEQPVVQTAALLEENVTPKITMYLQSKVISPEVKAALQEIIKRRAAIADVVEQRTRKQARLAEIGKEQERIRQNMAQLDRNSDLYKKYVEKLTAQEDEFDATRADIAQLQDQEKKLSEHLDQYIRGLKIG